MGIVADQKIGGEDPGRVRSGEIVQKRVRPHRVGRFIERGNLPHDTGYGLAPRDPLGDLRQC